MISRRSRNVIQVAVLAAVLLLACVSALAQDITYNVAPGADFSKYKTYKWIRIDGTEAVDPILDAQIKQSIDSQLVAKGLRQIGSDNADIYVGYQVSIAQEKQWYAYGSGGYYWGGGMATVTSSTLHVGTLGFDVYDSASKQLVWRGSATKTLNPPKDPAKLQKNIDKAVAKLLRNFAPPPKKS